MPGQCRSKTVFSRMVEQKERISVTASRRKAPQAKAHRGVSDKNMKPMRRVTDDQNLGDCFGGVYGVSRSP
ncbi:hypothetical protein L810_7324 [Burkholderia sp. AU4i]|nr:hypothetical protein L810_7324 [Burkholderia sp. AU4i]